MDLKLAPDVRKLIDDRVRSGKYSSPEEVVTAALCSLDHDEKHGEFETGEWERLLTEAEESGDCLDGDAVLAELAALRSQTKSKAG